MRIESWILIVGAVAVGSVALVQRLPGQRGLPVTAPITIDYPADTSVFPPEIAAPTVLFRDSADEVAVWRVSVEFSDGSPAIQAITRRSEERRVGKECR